jgi:hypothetical protein
MSVPPAEGSAWFDAIAHLNAERFRPLNVAGGGNKSPFVRREPLDPPPFADRPRHHALVNRL